MTMALSQKRSHESTLVGSETSDSDISMEGGKLTHLLSKSLLDLLLMTNSGDRTTGTTPAASNGNGSGNDSQSDVYQQYLNSSSIVTSESSLSLIERLEHWLSTAMATVGVGSNSNTLKFWRAHGNGIEDVFADGRYLVWFVKEIILLGLADVEGTMSTTEDIQGWDDRARYSGSDAQFRDHVLEVLEHWQHSAMDLLSKNGAKAGTEEGGVDTAGVLWQMLLQNAHLTPVTLRDAFDNFSSPQHHYEQNVLTRGNIDTDDLLPAEYFAWPTFFRCAASEAARDYAHEHGGASHPNKRRRSNDSTSLLVGGGGAQSDAWWPLFGYFITYAFISSPIKMTTEQKIIFLKENFIATLPSMMLIRNFDYNTKNSLLSGIVACVFDELGDWIVSDSLALSGEDEEESEEVCSRHQATVGRVVDLLLVDGFLPKLASLTRTPIAHLISKMADALLNYSEVNHRLHYQRSLSGNNEGDENYYVDLQQHVVNDATHVVHFIEKANPQLKDQLATRNVIPSYYASTQQLASSHPMVIYTRALLASNNLRAVADASYTLEDCIGVDEATKKHCYFLLFEKLQDTGVLYENGWNCTKKGGVTLANISIGAMGRECALDYLKAIVSMAKEELLSSSLRHNRAELNRLLGVKDIVRRTTLKFLLPRAYSPDEALRIATTISDAENFPRLENSSWGKKRDESAIDVAHCILTSRSLYPMLNEKFVADNDVIEEEMENDRGDGLEFDALPEEESADSKHEDSIEIGTAAMNEEVKRPSDNQESGVIDLEDTEEDEEDEAEPPNVQLAVSAATKSMGSVYAENSDVEGEVIHEDTSDLKEENRVTYPRHYHQFAGNYSESDEYEQEDEEEADRHLAYEGMYDIEEGQGESDGEENYEEPGEDLIEITSSVEDEDEEVDDDDEDEDEYEDDYSHEEAAEVDVESSEEETSKTDILNEAVNQFIAKENDGTGRVGDVEVNHESDENERANEQDHHDDGIVLKAAHQHIIATNAAKKGNNEFVEMASGNFVNDDQIPALDIHEKDSSMNDEVDEFHAERFTNDGNDQADDALNSPEEFACDTSDTDDMQMADDEHESIDTEDDKRSLAAASVDADDDKSSLADRMALQERESSEYATTGAPLLDDVPLNQSTEHDSDDERPSVLVAAAMSSQRLGNNLFELSSALDEEPPGGDNHSFDDTSAAQASMGANLWENYDDASQGEIDVDGTVDVQVARYLGQDLAFGSVGVLNTANDTGEDSNPETVEEAEYTDDGYAPDAEATEEDCASRAKRGDSSALSVVDDGYVPDAEFTEEDRPAKSSSKEERAVVKLRAARITSIDDNGTLTETMRVEVLSSPAKGIDAGYLPDGHTTAGEASEDDQCDDVVSAIHADRGEEVLEENPIDDMLSHGNDSSHDLSAPAESRLDDANFPSTVDGTENVVNVQEELSREMNIHVNCHNFAEHAASDDVVEQSSTREVTQVASQDNSRNVDDGQTTAELAVGSNQDESEPSPLQSLPTDHTDSGATLDDHDDSINATTVGALPEENDITVHDEMVTSRSNEVDSEVDRTSAFDDTTQSNVATTTGAEGDYGQTKAELAMGGNQDESEPSPLQSLPTDHTDSGATLDDHDDSINATTVGALPEEKDITVHDEMVTSRSNEVDSEVDRTSAFDGTTQSNVATTTGAEADDGQTTAELAMGGNQDESEPSPLQNLPTDHADSGATLDDHDDSINATTVGALPEEKDITVHDEMVASGSNEVDSEVDRTSALDDTTSHTEFEDFSHLTVAKLRERLKELNLPLGGRKQELIRRLNDTLQSNRNENQSFIYQGKSDALESDSISNKRKSTSDSVNSIQNKADPPSESFPVRASKRIKHPSVKSVESVHDNEKKLTRSARRKIGPSPRVNVSGQREDDTPALPVVPEDDILKGSAIAMEDTVADTRSNASIASTAENAVDGTNAPKSSRASKDERRTTRSSAKHIAGESKQNTSKTTNKSDNVVVKDESTQSVRTRSKKSTAAEDGGGRTSLQRSTRSKKDAENLSAGKDLPPTRGPGRSSKRVKEEETEGSSTAATMHGARNSSAKVDASSSGLRSSKRIRAKK